MTTSCNIPRAAEHSNTRLRITYREEINRDLVALLFNFRKRLEDYFYASNFQIFTNIKVLWLENHHSSH